MLEGSMETARQPPYDAKALSIIIKAGLLALPRCQTPSQASSPPVGRAGPMAFCLSWIWDYSCATAHELHVVPSWPPRKGGGTLNMKNIQCTDVMLATYLPQPTMAVQRYKQFAKQTK